jgi:hypothetical protein
MPPTDVLHILLGAVIAILGMMAGALADGLRRRLQASQPENEATKPRRVARSLDGRARVVSVLAGSGFSKVRAAEAVDACSDSERGTIESWTAAALRRCAGVTHA